MESDWCSIKKKVWFNTKYGVRGYVIHEKENLSAVIVARNGAISAKTHKDEIKSNDELSRNLNKLFVLSKEYPELKLDNNFKNLQEMLKESEEKTAYSRQFFNDTVLKYNNDVKKFPTVLVASMLGFKSE